MRELIERLRVLEQDHEPDGWPAVRMRDITALLDAFDAAQESACVTLVADIRFACGDNGTRMQPELVEFIRGLAEDAERLDWLDRNGFTAYRAIDPIDGLSGHCVVVHETQRPRRDNVADTIRQAIDQARGKEASDA